MQKVRRILRPPTEGTHFTVAEARAALLELRRERAEAKKQAPKRRKANAKRG
jgi:hypothetical protein